MLDRYVVEHNNIHIYIYQHNKVLRKILAAGECKSSRQHGYKKKKIIQQWICVVLKSCDIGILYICSRGVCFCLCILYHIMSYYFGTMIIYVK
jgi:hypothetical protein